MAVVNPNNLYTGGATVFDNQPETNMYAQLMLRKKAKEEALDEYDRQRMNHINETGLRDVDRQGLDQRINKIQIYYNQNKDKIRRGNTPESYEYEKLFRDVGGFVNQSKERTAKQDAAMKFYQEKLKQDGRVPDDFMHELENNDKGIDDIVTFDKKTGEPIRSSTFDLKKWLDTPKPFNQQTFLKGMADIKRTPTAPRYENILGQPLKMNEIVEEKFDDGAKQVIAARAADKYQNSYSFAETVKADINDPIRRAQLEKLFKDEYGTNPIQPEDYATAYSIELLQPKVIKTKTIDNKSAVMDRSFDEWKKKNAITSAQALQRTILNRSNATTGYNQTTGNAFDEISDLQTTGGKKIVGGTVYNDDGTLYTSPNGSADIFVPKSKLPASMLTSLKASGIDPASLGQGVNISVNNGVISGVETKKNGVISRQNMENFQKKFNTEPQKMAQPQFGKPLKSKNASEGKFPLPKGKAATVKQNGVIYTWNINTGKYE